MPTPLFLIDRCTFTTRVALIAAVKFHTSIGTIVRVEDSGRPSGARLCYEVSVFATEAALVD